jgi:hypothetical protein
LATIREIWDRLGQVTSLVFTARSASPSGWNGSGSGKVVVESTDAVLIFTESGTWLPDGGRELCFTNVFRWTRLDASGAIRLEHLRFGPERPVYLFDLAPSADGEWLSMSPHVCREDCYTACLQTHPDQIDLRWSVNGPSKQETIAYTYS